VNSGEIHDEGPTEVEKLTLVGGEGKVTGYAGMKRSRRRGEREKEEEKGDEGRETRKRGGRGGEEERE
jgi:hypothetical protein